MSEAFARSEAQGEGRASRGRLGLGEFGRGGLRGRNLGRAGQVARWEVVGFARSGVAEEFRQRERMFLHGDEMQAKAIRGDLPQSPPRGQKIQTRAKSGLNNRETVGLMPPRRQIVAVEEDMLCLRKRAVRRSVDIVELRGIERAVEVE